MTEETEQVRMYAHRLVEFPSYATGEDLVRQLARYHIARAFGFWQTADDPSHPNHVKATELFIQEYELALVWQSLASGTPSAPWAIATFVKAMISSPEDNSKSLHWLLKWAEIDPARILPYMPKAAVQPELEPTSQRFELDILSAINYDQLIEVRTAALHDAVGMTSIDDEDAAVLTRAEMYASWVLEPIAAEFG